VKVLRSPAKRNSNEQTAPGNQLLLEAGEQSEEENENLDQAGIEHSDHESEDLHGAGVEYSHSEREDPYEADIEHFFSESEDPYEADSERSDQENGDLQEMVVQHSTPNTPKSGGAIVQQTYTYSVQYL
jgi:hypothetical protein